MGEATVFRLRNQDSTELYLKIVDGKAVSELRSEIERTKWLQTRGIVVPGIIRVHEDRSFAACLMTAVPGRHPQGLLAPIPAIVLNLATGLRSLHSISADDCPFDESVAARLKRARKMITASLVSPEHFAERNRGLSPQSIYDRLVRSVPENEEGVLVHGDATFDNILIDDKGSVGFVDCGHAGLGDRYLDLQTILTDIEEYFGSKAKHLFAISYGIMEVDSRKLEFFSDLYELF
jgi:aminoglycoside phosphotransferase